MDCPWTNCSSYKSISLAKGIGSLIKEELSFRKVLMIIFIIVAFVYIGMSEGWSTALILSPAYVPAVLFAVFAIFEITNGSGKEILHNALVTIFSVGTFIYITIIGHWFIALIFALFYVYIINEIVSLILDLFIEDEIGGW